MVGEKVGGGKGWEKMWVEGWGGRKCGCREGVGDKVPPIPLSLPLPLHHISPPPPPPPPPLFLTLHLLQVGPPPFLCFHSPSPAPFLPPLHVPPYPFPAHPTPPHPIKPPNRVER
ncbi:hypothetical protein Pcinc_044190 [Petrolisthes cinctipes]|uniref:Uncharacterized protein n=1 Tax=Petrolisthes cinctipes TaxID=88211 RepID=A0AAE1BGA6_PETCI|nr:hypothetical protein Pcinc_044190 [Petrolisthes cinctipes]